jgi:hypothetical protein
MLSSKLCRVAGVYLVDFRLEQQEPSLLSLSLGKFDCRGKRSRPLTSAPSLPMFEAISHNTEKHTGLGARMR